MADQEMEESQQIVDLQKHHSGVATAPTLNNVQNIVSTVNLKCKLDLKAIHLRARNTRIVMYKPKRIPFLIMKIREPKTIALISASGMMIYIEAKSEQQSKFAARKYTRMMQKLGFPAKFEDFKILSPMNVNFRKWLEGLARSYGVNLVDEVSKSIQQLTI